MKELLTPLSVTMIIVLLTIFLVVIILYSKSNHLFAKLLQLTKKYLSGDLIQISLTFKCSLDCPYCCQKFNSGHRPNVKETNFTGWVRFFLRWPYKIREVYVSGGEPTMHKDFNRIVTFLLDKGYFVTVFSNLTNYEKIVKLPRCSRLCIASTFHHSFSPYKFDNAYKAIKSKHNIYVKENESQVLDYSKRYPLLNKENAGSDVYEIRCLRISPDLRINLNCYDLISE